MEKKYLFTPKEVAKILRLGTSKTYDLIHQSIIPSIKLDRKYLIPRDALEKFLGTCID